MVIYKTLIAVFLFSASAAAMENQLCWIRLQSDDVERSSTAISVCRDYIDSSEFFFQDEIEGAHVDLFNGRVEVGFRRGDSARLGKEDPRSLLFWACSVSDDGTIDSVTFISKGGYYNEVVRNSEHKSWLEDAPYAEAVFIRNISDNFVFFEGRPIPPRNTWCGGPCKSDTQLDEQ